MSNTVSLLGTLTAGPQGVCEGGFPAGVLQLQFGLSGGCPGAGSKSAAKKFWSTADVSTAVGVFAALDGAGTGQSVTKGTLLYVRSPSPIKIRLTTVDPAGGVDLVSVLPVHGLLILEFNSSGYLKLLEASGTGAVEYFVSGNE